jgi:alkylation response protein AidB-like acyl-CoA dehydrogenase
MDFSDTPEETAFRAEVRAFLDKNAERRTATSKAYRAAHVDDAYLKIARTWQAKKADAGFAAITWPVRYGGRGGTPIQQAIYNEEEAGYVVPHGVFHIGLSISLPTLLAYATPEQLDRHVRPALRGEEIWCQLFSEPAAGSDLAGIHTRAERDRSEWIVDGSKIWTSGAHYSDFAILLARTDPSVPKHKGLTFFFLDMKSRGIETQPIRQMWGASRFNQVSLRGVRIPDSQRLGGVGEGWKVALETLGHERFGVGTSIVLGPDFWDIFALARSSRLSGRPAIDDATVREKLVDWYVKQQGLRYTSLRILTALSRGQAPGPEASIAKAVGPSQTQEMAAFALDLQGMAGGLTDPEHAVREGWFQEEYLATPGGRLAGGTDEIVRNTIAERVLGLPSDIRVDKGVAFNQLPKGTR